MDTEEFLKFFNAVKTLRKAQKRFYNTKDKQHLIWALDAEKKIDKMLDEFAIEMEIREKNIYDKVKTNTSEDLFLCA